MVFRTSNICTSFVYQSQNVYKQVQPNKVAQLYLTDAHFQKYIKMILALAFIPTSDIFIKRRKHECKNCVQPILDYFECNFTAEMRRGVRLLSLSHHEMWNIYVNRDIKRTTCALEGWHNSFWKSLGQLYENVWIFIDWLKRELDLNRLALTLHIAGLNSALQEKKIGR